MEQHEREWKATWEDDAWDRAREFELFDPAYPVEALEVQEKTDANQCLPSPVQTNTTQSVALVKTSGSSAQAIQPVRGTVLPRSVQNAVRGRVGYRNNITPYEAAQGLMKTIPMFCIGKEWLVYRQSLISPTLAGGSYAIPCNKSEKLIRTVHPSVSYGRRLETAN